MSACALRTRRPEPHLRVVSACYHLSCPLLTINLPLPDRSICDAYTHTVAPIGRAGRLRAGACVCASNAPLHAPPSHRFGTPCLFSCLPDYAPNSSQTGQYSTRTPTDRCGRRHWAPTRCAMGVRFERAAVSALRVMLRAIMAVMATKSVEIGSGKPPNFDRFMVF